MKAIFALITVSMVSSQVCAAPAQQAADDVFVPHIFTPNAHTVWKVGTQQTVTWDVSNPPAQITNYVGQIFMNKDGEILLNMALASNFSILLGTIDVQVPNLPPGDDYSIVLFGDSGNDSQRFRIIN